MDLESSAIAALALGFLLGLKHATDADHVVAVSTIVGEYRNVWRGLWVGGSWALGHTTPLLALGVVILLFRGALGGYGAIAPLFEFGVGVMLVLLGVQVFWNLRRRRMHLHEHTRADRPHVHIHIHATHDPAAPEVETRHAYFHPGRPFFRAKSYAVGVVHGLAGSAAVMLILLPAIPSFWMGVGYLFLFGIGTMLSMAAITVALGVPFALTSSSEAAKRAVSSIAGAASVVLGGALMSDIALGTAIIPF